MIREFADIDKDISLEADVCVIGTGAGGGVVTRELAEKGLRVVALEEGSHFTTKHFNQDPGDMLAMMYRDSGTTVALGFPPVSITLGRCIGGTTTVNSASCFRTPKPVVEHWVQEMGCEGLSYEELIPYFERVEERISVTELTEDILGSCYQVVKRGAEKLGLHPRPLYHNVRNCEGAGVCQWGCIKNAKQSTNLSYIPQADKAGAGIYANCRVEKLVTESGRVKEVKGRFVDPATRKKTFCIRVKAPVVCLAMGTMITPAFLLKQRLANTSGELGKNLTIHPCGRVVAEMEEEVKGHWGVSQGGQIADFQDEGIMLEGIFIPPAIMTLALPGVGEEHKRLAMAYKNLAAFGVMVHDSSRGRVLPGLPGYAFTAFYQINREDLEKLRKGIATVSEIFFAAGAKQVFTGCYKMPVIKNQKEIQDFRKMKVNPWHFEIMSFHPLGTAKMGNDPGKSVVNIHLESHDIKGLFIPDGSPFPTSLGVNPQVSIMTFATRCADYIGNNMDRYR